MNSCQITIQRKVGEHWPVVLEQRAADAALDIRTVGSLSLNVMELSVQVTARDYGVMLGQALFQGPVREAFVHARAQSNDQLSVQLLVEAPDLSTLRWERLCAPLDERWHFLAHDQRAPLSLAPSSPSTRRFPLLRRENLRALVLVVSPQGLERYRLSPFHVETTVASIRTALGSIPCDVLSATPDAVGPPTLDSLCERLSNTSYTLLHVVCHGRYSSDISDTVIYLANQDQQVDPVTGQRLITRLSQLRGEQGLPQFAFLATCESASPEAEGVLGGLAQCLVRDLGLPAVLAMTETVSISTVEAVTGQFYRRLVAHGQVDLALAEACAGVAERADSLVPALYSRLGARPLFEQQALASHPQPLSLTHQQRKQNRARMLERVQRIWISGVLEQSLHGVALLTLGLQEQPNAITDPWRLVMQEAEQPARSLPIGTRITQVYDGADHELLILGAPGAGKTTLLLELTRDLLQRAQKDDTHPIPVVFHLSSWAVKRQPLKQWLMEELNLKYQVPRKLAQQWIETDQVLPLLDGLDEVKVDARPACIETINTYHQEHGFLPLVVASRSADYLAQTTRLRLSSAVTIQPLTPQHVDAYLAGGGEPLQTLRVALHQDAALRELAETPLMLSILTLTYHDMPIEALLQGGIAPTRQQIFEHYVERMLKRRGAKASYQPEQTRNWLTWLAKQLTQHGQTVFYIERLQPDWLSGSRQLRWYDRLAVRLPGVLIGILVTLLTSSFLSFFAAPDFPDFVFFFPDFITSILLGGLLGGLLSEGRISQLATINGGKVRGILWLLFFQRLLGSLLIGLGVGLWDLLILGLWDWPSIELFDGLSFGLSSILIQVFLFTRNTVPTLSQTRSPDKSTKWQLLIKNSALRNGLLVGLTTGLLLGLSAGLDNWLTTAMGYGLSLGLSAGLISLLLIGKSLTIQVTDRLTWSWTSLGRSLQSTPHVRATFQIVALVGMSIGLSNWIIHSLILSIGLSSGLSAGLSVGLSYWLLFGLFQGVSSETIGDQQRLTPNQGIRRSAFNGLVLGCIIALITGLISEMIPILSAVLSTVLDFGLSAETGPEMSIILHQELDFGLTVPLTLGLTFGLSAGLLAGLFKGGLASLRHYVLRFLLWRSKSMPRNYSRFLDHAAEHILLRKVGGGYIFVHRLLLEYFASLETPFPEETSAVLSIIDPPPAISSTLQSGTRGEEKASPTTSNRKTGFNKENRILTIFVVGLILLTLVSANIFNEVRQSVRDATATATAQANHAAQIKDNTTAEVLANSSPVAYPPPNKSPVINDPLQDNSKGYNWEVDDPSNGKCKFINRVYDINTHDQEWCIARTTDFTNFIYEVQMKIVKGKGGGIVFRSDRIKNFSAFYFAINQDGSYSVDVYTDSHDIVLAKGSSSAIHRGLNQINLVAVVVRGTIIELYVNHQRIAVVGSRTYSTYTHGQIGVIVAGSKSNQTEVIFQNAKAWKL